MEAMQANMHSNFPAKVTNDFVSLRKEADLIETITFQ